MKTSEYSFCIRSARIYDGSGGEPYLADLLIRNDRIAQIGELSSFCGPSLNADGLSLAPGFIDVHAHSDLSLLAAPEAFGKISQGITTEISGNCGLSAFPVRTPEVRDHLNSIYAQYDVPVSWSDFRTYSDALSFCSPAVNVMSLCGHNTLRANLLGYQDSPGSRNDSLAMKHLLAEMLEQGAAGFSTGLLYIPGKFASKAELQTIASALKPFDLPHATHLRSEGASLLESIEEAIDISSAGSNRLQLSHLKTARPENWWKIDSVFDAIERAQKNGMNICADRYPYTYAQTSLSVMLPAPYDSMSDRSISEALRSSPESCRTLELALRSETRWDEIILCTSSCAWARLCFGMTMRDAARQLSVSPAALTVRLMREDAPGTMAAFGGLSPENLDRILDRPYVCCGSDETARPQDERIGRSHPRGFGSFPRFLNLVKKRHTLSEALRRVTSLPAAIFRIPDRGLLRPGFFADLVLFRESALTDCSTFSAPHTPCAGISGVWVNGVLAYDGSGVVARPGRVIRPFRP